MLPREKEREGKTKVERREIKGGKKRRKKEPIPL